MKIIPCSGESWCKKNARGLESVEDKKKWKARLGHAGPLWVGSKSLHLLTCAVISHWPILSRVMIYRDFCFTRSLWLFGGKPCERMREKAGVWLRGCGSHPGERWWLVCLEVVGMGTLWFEEGILPVLPKCCSNTFPQWLVYFIRNNIAS